MFQIIAFIFALLACLIPLLKDKEFKVIYVLLVMFIGGCFSLFISLIGGYLFPAEALEIATQAELISTLLEHFFSSFIGAVIPPFVQWLYRIKLE